MVTEWDAFDKTKRNRPHRDSNPRLIERGASTLPLRNTAADLWEEVQLSGEEEEAAVRVISDPLTLPLSRPAPAI